MTAIPPPPPPPGEQSAYQTSAQNSSNAQYVNSPYDQPTVAVNLSPRQQYRRVRTRRKTIIFGSAILGLLAATGIGIMGVAGMLPMPFGEDFSREVTYAEIGDTPCPTPGARPQSPEGVSLRILNTTSTPGLAGKTAKYFESLGYTIAGADNAPPYRGVAKIEAGPRGVDAAYTVARYLGSDVQIILNATEDRTLTVSLGQAFDGTPSKEDTEAILASNFALVPVAGCLPVAEPAGGWELPESGEQSGQSGPSGQSD